MLKYAERSKVLLLLSSLVALIFLIRLFYIQVIDDEYAIYADNNAIRKEIMYPPRGLIYDKNGKILVRNETVYDVMVIPAKVRNLDTAALCNLLEVDLSDFEQAFQKAKTYSRFKPSPVVRQISTKQYGHFQERLFEFTGFYMQARTMRYYPYSTAAHLLGYIGEVDTAIINNDPESYYKMGDYIGQSGLEKMYEKELRGKKGYRNILVDVLNREQGSYRDGLYDSASVAGSELYTGLDLDLQLYAEKLMKGKRGTVVAIEPSTGKILTLLSAPSYDPNLLVGRQRAKNFHSLLVDKEKPLFNRALNARYRPGSIFKIVQSLVALQLGVITPETGFPCNKGIIGCHNHPSAQNITQAIQFSCNPYFYKVYQRIIQQGTYSNIYKDSESGLRKWDSLVQNFSFGRRMETDLPNINSGFVPNTAFYDKWYGKNRWAFSTIYSNSIGEGELGVVPLQMANLACIIANRGYYITPHLVAGIGEDRIPLKKYTTRNYVGVDPKYFKEVIDGMELVVEAGTARQARIKDIIVCGKTGTVQNINAEDHSVFIAFAPKDSPKIAIAVYVENAGWGGSWAAPISSLLIEKYIKDSISRPALEERMLNAKFQESENYPFKKLEVQKTSSGKDTKDATASTHTTSKESNVGIKKEEDDLE